MVLRFLSDASGSNFDRAYQNTSASFKGYVPRKDFEQWMNPTRLDPKKYDYGHLALDEEWNVQLNLDPKGPGSRMVFVWENHGWKFKHWTSPR